VRCTEPNQAWEVRFDDGDGTRIAFDVTALMEPFDIHDPEQDPMVAAQAEGSDFAWGTAYNGHFDLTGRFEGEIELRGRRYDLDCVSTMDHSWGPRPEKAPKTMSWLHAHVDDETFLHAIFDFPPTDGPDGESSLRLTHGYVRSDGRLLGLAGGGGTTVREGCFPVSTDLHVTDGDGRDWDVHGEALTTFPWQAWPDVVGFDVLHRWELAGREAFGEAMDFYTMHHLGALHDR
jgi:hypothetical protein